MIRRTTRLILPAALAALVFAGVAPGTARAQEPPPAEGGGDSGRPFDGYFATGILVFGALFAVGKSARR